MSKRSIHMIKPGRAITVNRMVEAYCQVLFYDQNATHVKQDVTCRKCRTAHENEKQVKKFA